MSMKEKLDKPIDEIEVDDEMVLAAAKDINDTLKPNPLLDLEKPGEDLQKEIEELLEGIIEGDNLSDDTWKILKALGWKSANQEQATNEKEDQSVKEKTKMKTNAGEFAMAAADVQKSLAVNPPLDLNVGEEALKEELVSLLPNIQEGDDLAATTWVTLKKLGWKDTDKKKTSKTSTIVRSTTVAASQTYTMLKLPVNGPKQMIQIVECLKKGPLASDRLLAAMAKVVKTKQSLASILRFYQKKLVAEGYIKVS